MSVAAAMVVGWPWHKQPNAPPGSGSLLSPSVALPGLCCGPLLWDLVLL